MKSRTLVGDFNGACANTAGAAVPRNGIATPALTMVRRVTLGFLLLPNLLSPCFPYFVFLVFVLYHFQSQGAMSSAAVVRTKSSLVRQNQRFSRLAGNFCGDDVSLPVTDFRRQIRHSGRRRFQ